MRGGGRRGRGPGMGAGKGMERTRRLAARTSGWGGSGDGGGGGGSPGKFARAWGAGDAGALQSWRVCAGVEGTRARSQKKAGRGEGGAGPEAGGAAPGTPPLLPLPSPAPFSASHGTPPATPGLPHNPRRQSSVCSFAGCLASRTVLGCCRPLLLHPRLLLLFGWPLDVRKPPTEALQTAPCPGLFRLPVGPPSSNT